MERTAVTGRIEVATVCYSFFIYLVKEILFLSEKSREILKTDVCGIHGLRFY